MMPLVPLVLLADVEEERLLVVLEEPRPLGGVDLVDFALDLVEELAIGGHWFKKDSASEWCDVHRNADGPPVFPPGEIGTIRRRVELGRG